MKGTIGSAVLPILLTIILCSPVLAGVRTDGTEVVTELDAHVMSVGGDRAPSPHPPETEPSPLVTSFSTGEAPETTGDTETAPPGGLSTTQSGPASPGGKWHDPRDADVELATWGKVKDLFSE